MKAKLIKDNDGYWLDISDNGITKRPLTDFGQLSIQNCEAIANGYDLDELANDHWDEDRQLNDPKSFRDGFQKALEILGDKKFSKEDMFEAVMFGCSFEDPGIEGIETYNELKDLVITRNTQTEWDVEVEQELIQSSIQGEAIWELKLDTDGCLILKRI
jgi:hypothetical protein